jgi:hypothetical protein
VVVTDLAGRKQGAVLEGHFRFASIELGARLIVLLGYPVVIPCFFASVAEEAGIFLAVEAEDFIAVE